MENKIIEILEKEGLMKCYTDYADDIKDEDKLRIAHEIVEIVKNCYIPDVVE